MEAVYLDASLVSELGHFAGACRSISSALRSVGIPTTICGHSRIDATLAADLEAIPLFNFSPNSRPHQDPVCGWLLNYQTVAQGTLLDLRRLNGINADHLVIYNCAGPAQIAALSSWAQQSFSPTSAPTFVVILGWHPGMAVTSRDGLGNIREWRLTDPASALYRFAVASISDDFRSRFRFAAPDRPAAAGWTHLLGTPVEALPYLQLAATDRHSRRGKRTPTIAFLGEQRENKGYHLVPGIVRRLLSSLQPLRILVQNSWSLMEAQNNALRQMAVVDPRIELRIGTVSSREWSQLLCQCDLVVLPYDVPSYSTVISGIGAEALANAIPQAVPANTGLELLLREYGTTGIVFPTVSEAAVADAVLEGLVSFDFLADQATAAAALWESRNGPDHLAKALLSTHTPAKW